MQLLEFSKSIELKSFLFVACLGLFGCSAESGPINLPIPFSGALTPDTNIVIAEGAPLSGGSVALKIQTTTGQSFPIRWQTFDGTAGAPVGDLTFLSITTPVVTPFEPEGVRRSYILEICSTLADGTVVCSENLQCFEYPTDVPPTFNASDVTSDPDAVAVVRKAACSGNNTLNGQLIDAKFLLGMVQLPNGDFLFHTQEESPILVNGLSFLAGSGSPSGDIVMTLLTQGGSTPLPGGPGIVFRQFVPVLLPGSDEIVGTETQTFTEFTPRSDELFEVRTDVQFLLEENSSLTLHDGHALVHVVPEMKGPVSTLLATEFACDSAMPDPSCDPAVTPSLLEDGIVIFNSISETAPVNCDPDAKEATGIFQELCQEHGGLRAQFICHVYANLLDFNNVESFTLEGVWVLLKP